MTLTILLAEPEVRLAQMMADALQDARFVVEPVADGEQVEAWAKVNKYDALILALDLPWQDGRTILRNLREHDFETPIFLLGKREQLPQLIKALDTGADDFLTLPFPPAELTARLKAVLRRCHHQRSTLITALSLNLDQAQRKIHEHGQELTLTAKEFGLLELLIRRAGQVVSRGDLVEAAWCDTLDAMLSHRLENHICQLRKKLCDPSVIRAHAGRGYELVNRTQRNKDC
jgi:DNA-binding response OmpR family regulator